MRDHTKLRAFELADEVAILTYSETWKDVRVKVRRRFSVFLKSRLHL
jgi:hypothetical protein